MASRRHGAKDQTPGWAWMLLGLSIGLAVALVVYLQSGDSTLDFTEPAPAAAERRPSSEPAAPPAARDTGTAAAESEEEFSFFRLLPESEVVVPENGSPARPGAGPAQEYIIQAGSYSEYAEADGAQAELALLGIESKVERAIVGNEIRYRVIIGPLSNRDEIASTVRRLNAASIDSMPPRPVGN